MKDALALEAECPNVLCVLPKNEARATFKTYQGNVTESTLKGCNGYLCRLDALGSARGQIPL